ncbi:MAG: hypothetical protein GEU94_04430 [Micromonosporaceae bacterium]|nr:hypothetical protein [Micromonosporaceae bacterium]
MTGRHRHPATRPIAAGAALVAALAVGGLLLAMPTPEPEQAPDRSRAAGPSRLSDAWPKARTGEYDSTLADGASYTPILFLNLTTSVGTAPTLDQERERLLLVAKGRKPRRLGSLPAEVGPGFNGVVSDGERVVWAETVPGSQGVAKTTLWIAEVSGGEARTLTTDTGDVIFFGSQHDLQVVGGRLHWASQPGAGKQKRPATEIRSVPLSGGKVEVRTFDGGYSMAGWPWLASITRGGSEPVTLKRATGGRTVTARPGAGELLTCGARWCRVIVLGDQGRTRLDVMKPNGSARRRVAGGDATPAVVDIMLLGRFEPLTAAARNGSAADQRLLLYDGKTRRTVLVADSLGTVHGRDGFLWWSVGEAEVKRWHVLDLRSL